MLGLLTLHFSFHINNTRTLVTEHLTTTILQIHPQKSLESCKDGCQHAWFDAGKSCPTCQCGFPTDAILVHRGHPWCSRARIGREENKQGDGEYPQEVQRHSVS